MTYFWVGPAPPVLHSSHKDLVEPTSLPAKRHGHNFGISKPHSRDAKAIVRTPGSEHILKANHDKHVMIYSLLSHDNDTNNIKIV